MSSNSAGLLIREIDGMGDPAWAQWKTIYLESFPENERMSLAYFEAAFAAREKGEEPHFAMLAMTPQSGPDEVIGIAYYTLEADGKIGYLWYLATRADRRGSGHGAVFYRAILDRAQQEGARLVLFEVEIPEVAGEESPEAAALARRRIEWYRRQGARLLRGIHYLQRIDTGVPPTEMYLMVHPLTPLNVEEVFTATREVFEDAVRQTGPLSLD